MSTCVTVAPGITVTFAVKKGSNMTMSSLFAKANRFFRRQKAIGYHVHSLHDVDKASQNLYNAIVHSLHDRRAVHGKDNW